ncbi:MAG: hypothetical protein KBB11_07025 [Bacteroidales bacterium]|nr:hypothetical protein [Bacteroidales bacterium]HOY40019.1 hypothetical protein [Bacteroidales bacterium]
MKTKTQPVIEKLRSLFFGAMLIGLTLGFSACEDYTYDDDDDDDEDVIQINVNENEKSFEMDSLNNIDLNKPEE